MRKNTPAGAQNPLGNAARGSGTKQALIGLKSYKNNDNAANASFAVDLPKKRAPNRQRPLVY